MIRAALDVSAYYEQYGPMVLRRCRKLLKNEARALDAMQDVFVNLLHHQERIVETAPANLMMRMATNICLNIIAADQRHPEFSNDEMLSRIAHGGPNSEASLNAKLQLEHIFQDEKESTRSIAVMHLLDGMTLEEVASEVGMSVSGVRKRLRTLQTKVGGLAG